MNLKFLAGVLLLPVLSSGYPATAAASIKAGSTCKVLNKVTLSNNVKFQCNKVGKKQIWKKVSTGTKIELVAPGVKPDFTVEYIEDKVWALVNIPSKDYLKENNIKFANAVIYAKTPGAYTKVGETNFDFANWKDGSGTTLSFTWNLKNQYKGYEFAVEAKFTNQSGQSPKAIKVVFIPETSPSPSPSPSPSVPTSPSATPSPTAESGCSVNYLSALPYSSQRIALTSISWERDASGYVSAIASLRNDNTMSLRLVEFSFFASHKTSVVNFDQTLQGNSFFIKDDARFNSLDGQSDSWLPGQTRTFKLPSNQILECRSISVFASGFSVAQGIGG